MISPILAAANSTIGGGSSWDFISSNLWAVFIGIVIAVVGAIVAAIYYDRRHAPKLKFDTRGKTIEAHSEKLGFYVSMERKGVDDATPFCNGVAYDWEEDNGTTAATKNLRVGDAPSSFYPFIVQAAWLQSAQFTDIDPRTVTLKREGGSMDTSDYQGGVYFVFSEAKSHKPFYWLLCPIESGQKSAHLFDFSGSIDFEAKVKVVAKGVDVGNKDYTKGIGLTALNVIGLEEGNISFDFSFGGLASN